MKTKPALLALLMAQSAGAQEDVTLSEYCETFAQTYARSRGLATYQAGSATTTKKPVIMRLLSNVFQPSDSKFTAGYDCSFRTRDEAGTTLEYSVGLFLTNTLAFAEHTAWPTLQLIPIAHVTDAAGGRAGYGVFKYMEKP